jgi:2-dehydropantoate 2-reductase
MKFAILGAGALGSILACHLVKAGEDVVLIARGARAKHLAENGVTISGLSGINIAVPVTDDPQTIEQADVFIMTAKTYDTEAALESVRHFKPGVAFSVQNGVLKNEQLARVFGPEATLGCIADFSGEVLPDGTVLFTRNEGLHIGELPEGRSQRVDELAAVFNEAGIRAIASERIESMEWSKYVGWMAVTAVAVLTRLYTHVFYQDPDLARLQVDLTLEGAALAEKLSIELQDLGAIMPRTLQQVPPDEGAVVVQKIGATLESRGITTHKMSALQDVERGRRIEVEETLGYALRKAAELNVPIPGLETCYRLLAGLNRTSG